MHVRFISSRIYLVFEHLNPWLRFLYRAQCHILPFGLLAFSIKLHFPTDMSLHGHSTVYIQYTAHIHKHIVAYAYTASVRIRIHTYAINNNFWGDFSCRSVQFISYFGHLCTTHTVSCVFFEPNATTSSTVDLPFMFNLYHFIPCLTCGRCMRYKMKMRISS